MSIDCGNVPLFDTKEMVEAYEIGRPKPPKAFVYNLLEFYHDKVGVPPVVHVMDVGCGPGSSTRIIADVLPDATIVGVDFSQAQIDAATANFENNDRVRFKQCDANTHLPAENGSVNLLTCVLSIHWLDIPKFYAQCDRVLSHGGVLAAVVYKFGDPVVKIAESHEASHEISKAYMQLWYTVIESTSKQVQRLMEDEYSSLPLPYSDTRAWIRPSEMVVEKHMNFEILLKKVQSMGALQTYLERDPTSNIYLQFSERCQNVLKKYHLDEDMIEMKFTVHYSMYASRKP